MSKFKYHKRSEETVNKRANQSGGDYDSYLISEAVGLKIKEGENILRILPPTWDVKGKWGENWCIDVWLHWDVGADNGSYLCLRKMKDEDCPICDSLADIDDEEQVKRLKAKRSLLAYVIDRNAEKEGPQIWRLGVGLEAAIQGRCRNKKTGAIMWIDDPENGHDISFVRKGTDQRTKYVNEDVEKDETPIHDDERRQDKWLDYIADHPLPDMLNYHDAEHIASVLKGRKSSKKANNEDDDRPTRASRNRSRDSEDEEEDPRDRRRSGRDEEPRSSRRGRDADEDEVPSRRQMEENTSRARGRRDESEDEAEERPARRRASEEAEERPARRRSRDDDDEKEDDKPPRRASRASHDEDTEEEDARPTREERRRPAPKDEEDDKEPPKREAHRPAAKAAEEEEEEDAPPSRRNRPAAPKEDDVEEDDDDPDTTSRAKKSLERLKPKAK